MKLRLYWIKFKTYLEVAASRFVYNFNKFVPNVKAKRNIKYVEKGNKYNKLDVFYPVNTGKEKLPVVVYFHGGGWAAYSKTCYATLCKKIAAMGYVVFNCNYSLAPKHKMPKIIADAKEAILFASKNASKFGGDGNKICLGGDSAGAHIASFVSALATSGNFDGWLSKEEADKFCKIVKANMLFYGAFDLNSILFSDFHDIVAYMGGLVNLKDKTVSETLKSYSPVHLITPSFPPSLVASGEIDKLHESQSKVFADVLDENKVHCEKVFFEQNEFRAMHAYMVIDGLKTTETTFNCVEAFLSEVFDK